MPRATSSTNVIATIGIDIGKNTFHLIGLDDDHARLSQIVAASLRPGSRAANAPKARGLTAKARAEQKFVYRKMRRHRIMSEAFPFWKSRIAI